MKTYYYVFKGQNATWGNPNPKTGRCSTFGELKAFTTRAKRDEYCDNVRLDGYEFVQKCNKKTARQFFLGVSVAVYDDCVKLASLEADAAYKEYFGE
jgi:hypothetical protein